LSRRSAKTTKSPPPANRQAGQSVIIDKAITPDSFQTSGGQTAIEAVSDFIHRVV
jgi:hypothetical protein